ncbi:MAG: acetoacetate decarboxylase family protein [Actinomycetota bacterium]|nr:acetoacetate decarboxylase family protein [Actinomycetota bacterium]
MGLSGWSLPLSPNGRASLVPPPPWHFSGTAIGVDFRADPEAVAAVVPPALRPEGDGAATFVFVEWSSSADSDPRLAADPARGQYREAYVAVHARLDGAKVGRVPYIWVDSDLSLARGHIQGFPKKAGTVALTNAVRIGRGGPRLEAGARFAAHVSSVGRRLATGSVELAEPAPEGFVPRAMRLPLWHTRLVPDLAGGPPLVHDLARNLVTDFAMCDVWTGPAELEVGGSDFEEIDALRPVEVTGGFRGAIAFTITGAEIRPA